MRGAWIEIAYLTMRICHHSGRSPCGERGLKYVTAGQELVEGGRSPCGERGLKYEEAEKTRGMIAVAPHAGSVD